MARSSTETRASGAIPPSPSGPMAASTSRSRRRPSARTVPTCSPTLSSAHAPGPHGKWVVRRLARPAVKFGFDDRPSLAVTSDGRVHVVWSRLLEPRYQTTVISSSSDGGRTWSAPRPIDRRLQQPQLVSLSAGPGNTLYIAGVDASMGIWVGRSADGGRSFTIARRATTRKPCGDLPRVRGLPAPAAVAPLHRPESRHQRRSWPRVRDVRGDRRRRCAEGPCRRVRPVAPQAVGRSDRPGRLEEDGSVLAGLRGRSEDRPPVGLLLRLDGRPGAQAGVVHLHDLGGRAALGQARPRHADIRECGSPLGGRGHLRLRRLRWLGRLSGARRARRHGVSALDRHEQPGRQRGGDLRLRLSSAAFKSGN